MRGHARTRRRLVWYDPVGTMCKWTYGAGVVATVWLLAQLVQLEHHHNAIPSPPPVSVPDLPPEE
ncbi:hypothetical protein [Streptomyces roseifaciens]|uniref:hypothetical protein n=1 Tax=Streptomyces roseifaciens TaxID=1488406 RepID=UPI000B039050|nr:hypothetical protein [Streptomyces roseifaciens]